MIALIARRELQELIRDKRLLWAGGLVVILLLTALLAGWQQERAANAERAAAQRLDYDDWLAQKARHPHDAAHQGMHVFKPQAPLSIVDPGITPYVGSTQWLRAHRQSELKFLPAQDATGLQRFGSFSAAWILQVLGPLLVIVLGFNAFAGEREQGTLRQLMSLGVAPARLLWGKALALAAALALLLMPMALIAAGLSVAGLDSASRGDTLLRFFALAAGYGVYLGIAIFVVLAVSGWAKSSRLALMALLALWIAGVILAPRAVSDVAERAYPTPSRVEFNNHLESDLDRAYAAAWQAHFGVKQRWGADLPLSRWGLALQVDDEAGYGVTDQHFGALWESFARQQRLQEWSGVLFPVLALRSFSMGIAGTDFAGHRDFAQAAERQRRVMQDLISDDLVHHADPLGDRHFAYQADAHLWAEVPPFAYTLPQLAAVLPGNALSFAILCAGLALAAALAWLATPRRA